MIYTFTLLVSPGDVSNNARLIPQKVRGRFTGRLVDATPYRDGLASMAFQVRSTRNRNRWPTLSGRCSVSATTYWKTEAGDVDATSKAILDALQQGGAIVNDKQVRPLHLDRGTDKARPRIEITVEVADG